MTWLLPSEFKRWRSSVLRRCKVQRCVPCSAVFVALVSVVKLPERYTSTGNGLKEVPQVDWTNYDSL